jgi:predicted ester cyclase
MSAEKNKAIVRRFYEEVVNTGEVDGLDEFISEGYAEVHSGEKQVIGIEGAKAHIHGVRQTDPDLRLSIERQIAEGEWVATCITTRGTHQGSWLGIEDDIK